MLSVLVFDFMLFWISSLKNKWNIHIVNIKLCYFFTSQICNRFVCNCYMFQYFFIHAPLQRWQ